MTLRNAMQQIRDLAKEGSRIHTIATDALIKHDGCTISP